MIYTSRDLERHAEHRVEIAEYGAGANYALQCEQCGVIVIDGEMLDGDENEWIDAQYLNATDGRNDARCPECNHFGKYHDPDAGCLVENTISEYCSCSYAPIDDWTDDDWPMARMQREPFDPNWTAPTIVPTGLTGDPHIDLPDPVPA